MTSILRGIKAVLLIPLVFVAIVIAVFAGFAFVIVGGILSAAIECLAAAL